MTPYTLEEIRACSDLDALDAMELTLLNTIEDIEHQLAYPTSMMHAQPVGWEPRADWARRRAKILLRAVKQQQKKLERQNNG